MLEDAEHGAVITANKIKITPTIFPDGTSQVWKLPKALRQATEVNVVWDFEHEREIIDLLSLRRLLYSVPMKLHCPFLPYARQDKQVKNLRTFNLEVLADLLNGMRLAEVTAVDVHNELRTRQLIKNFRNIEPTEFHFKILDLVNPDVVVFPDDGAFKRYYNAVGSSRATMSKDRDQATGKIKAMYLPNRVSNRSVLIANTALILDDLCDGGATFAMCAEGLRKINPDLKIHLAVTHGIFSRGVEPLEKAG